MEIVLAIVVASAVIFFGALISMGNERQRKAIDDLREQIMLWAIQDLRIKQGKLEREVHVEDPLEWLSAIASRTCGAKLDLEVSEFLDSDWALVCTVKDATTKVVFSRHSPTEFRKISRIKRNRLSQMDLQDHILEFAQKAHAYEISPLNSNLLFDLELQLVWKMLTKHEYGANKGLWVYVDL